MSNKVTAALVIISVILSSCNVGFTPHYSANNEQPAAKSEMTVLASRMTALQEYGYFPSSFIQNRSVTGEEQGKTDFSALSSEEQATMNQIANSPETALQEISKESNGKAQLVLIDTLLSDEATVQDVFDAMYTVDTDMAYEYLEAMEERVEQVDNGRSVQGNDILGIKLRHVPKEDNSRGMLASDMNWDTIGWYIGYCAVATAGLVTYKAAP